MVDTCFYTLKFLPASLNFDFISEMKKTAITHEVELATGTETFVHPETPSDTDSMALAIKGT